MSIYGIWVSDSMSRNTAKSTYIGVLKSSLTALIDAPKFGDCAFSTRQAIALLSMGLIGKMNVINLKSFAVYIGRQPH